jgi:hypothetical protein
VTTDAASTIIGSNVTAKACYLIFELQVCGYSVVHSGRTAARTCQPEAKFCTLQRPQVPWIKEFVLVLALARATVSPLANFVSGAE